MGRATSLSHYVKYGKEKAAIEIRLKERDDKIVKIKRTFTKEERSGGGEWFMDGLKAQVSQVQKLLHSLNIQLGNLCQFLPQDKVFEFARLDPVQLLCETQKLVANEDLINLQNKLIELRKEDRLLIQVPYIPTLDYLFIIYFLSITVS